jgi:hypothetical protein
MFMVPVRVAHYGWPICAITAAFQHRNAMVRHLVHWTVLAVVSLAMWSALGLGLFLLVFNGSTAP